MADGSRSSGMSLDNAPPGWIRWAMPSIADLIFVALLAALVCTGFSAKLLNDASIGWHIRTGQQILATHAIPRVDPFSSQIARPWIAWEWFYDVIVGLLEAKLGLNGVAWFTAVIISVVFAFVFRIAIIHGTSLPVALLLTLLAVSASMIHFLARPHVLTWLFALAWFWILDSSERHALSVTEGLRSTWLWFLPPSMLLWVNLHGGFLLGFVFLFIFWMAALWTWLKSKQVRIEESFQKIAAGRRVRDLTLIGLLSVAASFLNPYGGKLHAHVVSYLSNRFLMSRIEEFQSPNFHGTAQRCFLVLLLITIATIAVRHRRLRLSELLLVLFAVYAGLYAARNIPVSSILLVLIVAPRLCSSSGSGFIQRMSVVDSRARGHLWPVIATVALFMIALNGGRIGLWQLISTQFSPARMPVNAVNYLTQAGIRSPLLGPDYWGGYLIYRLYPQARVVVDDRHDFYGEEFLKVYLKFIHVEPGWEELLAEQEANCLLIPAKNSLTVVLRGSPEWKLGYADDVAVVFLRTGVTQKGTNAAPGL